MQDRDEKEDDLLEILLEGRMLENFTDLCVSSDNFLSVVKQKQI